MSKCPKCGSGDRDIALEDNGVGHDGVTTLGSVKVEDTGIGHDMVSLSGSLVDGYSQLSSSFTIDQKRLADSLNLPSGLELLNRIAVNQEKALKLVEEQRDDAISESKRDHGRFIIGTVLGVVGIVIALVAILVAVFHL